MNIQYSDLTPRNMFVRLWLRSVLWSTVYGSILGAVVTALLINGYSFLVWADIVPSNSAYDTFSSTLDAMLLYIPFEIFAGALIGGALGMLQGVFTGLLIGRVTVTRFYPPSNEDRAQLYRQIMGRLSIISAFFITLSISAGYTTLHVANDDAALELGDALIVTTSVFLITYAAWRASRCVCRWYIGIELQSTGVE